MTEGKNRRHRPTSLVIGKSSFNHEGHEGTQKGILEKIT
jgi:hypothetical protein